MRTFNAAFLNEVANDPLIRPMLGGTGEINMSEAANNANNYFFVNENGGFVGLLLQQGGTRIECHTIFKPGTNFKEILKFSKECLEYVFTRTPVTEVVTKVPDDNKGAGLLAEKAGFVEEWRTDNAWKPGVGVSYRVLTLDRWLRVCCSTQEAGKAFHDFLDASKKSHGSEIPSHPEDKEHDCWVGAAILMGKQGNLAKGVDTYNRWAYFAGYDPVTIVSIQPPIINSAGFIIGMNGQELELLQCPLV